MDEGSRDYQGGGTASGRAAASRQIGQLDFTIIRP